MAMIPHDLNGSLRRGAHRRGGNFVRFFPLAQPALVMVAPHNPNGPVSLAAMARIAACSPNFLITEYVHMREAVCHRFVKEPLRIVDGHVPIPTAPGLGVELDEDAIAAHPAELKEIWHPRRIVV